MPTPRIPPELHKKRGPKPTGQTRARNYRIGPECEQHLAELVAWQEAESATAAIRRAVAELHARAKRKRG